VDEARGNHRVPGSEAIAMSAAAWVMAGPGRFATAQRAARLGRPLGRRRGRISQLPPPLSAWTRARDLPVPPVQTFRQWWRDEHEKPS
jgi:L-lactate dehydrogenase complex protein LldF